MSRERIVVGVDGSPGSRRALAWTVLLAKRLEAQVLSVLALRPVGEFVVALPPFPVDTLEQVTEALDGEWSAPLREAGVPYRTEVLEMDPASALMEVARKEGAGLIVVGSDGHGGIAERLLGSVTYRLVHDAPVPVVVVPRER